MESTGIVPTMNFGSDGCGFGSNGLWLFAILALMNGGFGGWNRGYGFDNGRYATVEDINNNANFTRLESQVRSNADLTERKIDGVANGISSLGYEIAQQFGNTNTQIASGFCTTSKEIMESRYLNEKAIADSSAVLAEKINALGAKIDQNKIESLQAKVNELQLNQAMCGVVRYPMAWTYNAGQSPFCNCGSCCNGGNI